MQYTIDSRINSGKFGTVYKVQKDGKYFAAKILPKHRIDMPKHRNSDMIKREIDHHKRVNNHSNIVKLIDVVEDWGNYFLIEDFCEKGDLDEYATNKLNIDDIKRVIKDCLNGLIACHKAGFIFGDLKPSNILVDDCFKLCDFGSSHQANDLFSGCIHLHGTPAFLAPECYVHRLDDGFISDMWSLGILAYLLLYEKYPYDIEMHCSSQEFKNIVNNSEIKYEKNKITIDTSIEDFVKKCLQKDPKLRLTPENALEHQFLK